MNEEQRPYHEAANIFPLMQGDEYEALRADIAEYGQREPIHVDDEGAIIDGRNRHRACLDLDIAPRIETWRGGSVVAFVISANLHRRHLNSGQRAAISLEALPLFEAEAEKRMLAGKAADPVEIFPQGNGKARDQAAAAFGTNPRYVSDAKKLHDEAPDLFEQVKAGEVGLPRAKREAKQRQKVAEVKEYAASVMDAPPLTKAYNVIYADPPWQYTTSGGFNTLPGVTDLHYATMPIQDICSYLDDQQIKVRDNAVLFLWVTNPFLEIALRVVSAWGFTYKTNIVWRKTDLRRLGVGYYVRGQHELLYICTRGSFTPLDKHITPPITSVIEAPLGEHSQKPSEVYDIIESLYSGCTYLELFAREERAGWDRMGNEA
jgi:N6-adenosine-specific RNA methylase IME4